MRMIKNAQVFAAAAVGEIFQSSVLLPLYVPELNTASLFLFDYVLPYC
jgi:hypothetical protein